MKIGFANPECARGERKKGVRGARVVADGGNPRRFVHRNEVACIGEHRDLQGSFGPRRCDLDDVAVAHPLIIAPHTTKRDEDPSLSQSLGVRVRPGKDVPDRRSVLGAYGPANGVIGTWGRQDDNAAREISS